MIFRNPFTQTSQPGNPQGPNQQQQGNMQQQNSQNTSLENGNNQQTNQGNMTIPGNNQQVNQQQGNNQQGQQNQQSGGDDPMMKFDQLWQNPTVDPNDPNQNQQQQDQSYLPKLDPAKLQEYVGQMDFTKNVLTPELMAQITAGGEGATNAMMTIINGATKQAMMTAFQASTRMMETGLRNAEGGFLGKVPDHVKDIMVRNQLTSSNPIMSDPAYGELVEVTRTRFQTKYPKATPAQIEGAVNKYFDEMHAKMTGAKNKATETPQDNTAKLKAGAGDADWNEWASSEVGNIFGTQPQ